MWWYSITYAITSTVFKTTLITQLYVRVHILLTCGKHLHARIISLRGLVPQANLIAPLFIEVPVPSHGSDRLCMYIYGIGISGFLLGLFVQYFYKILEMFR